MSDPLSTLLVLVAVLGYFGLLERRMERLEAHMRTGFTEVNLEIREVRADIVRHLELHIENQ